MKRILLTLLLVGAVSGLSAQETIPVQWEQITSPDFDKALEMSGGVCIVPMGVLEKHGPHLPVGTDVFNAHGIVELAAQQEYAVVYPFYYFGQINEARHQRGTVAYSPELVYKALEETCSEIARNGFKKIILYSYHGGNGALVQYFCQNQLNSKRDYVVYQAMHKTEPEAAKKIDAMLVSKTGGHADEEETSTVMVFMPNTVKLGHAADESGENQNKAPLKNLRPGIWWYASYPNHYAGQASAANVELGKVVIEDAVNVMVKMIRDVKADTETPRLQNEFFQRVDDL